MLKIKYNEQLIVFRIPDLFLLLIFRRMFCLFYKMLIIIPVLERENVYFKYVIPINGKIIP